VGETSPERQAAIVAATASNLRIDAATAEAVRALDAAGGEAILLKGPALSDWYSSDSPDRTYLDCDLWIRPTDLGLAERVLAEVGYFRAPDQADVPQWWLEHATSWYREADGVTVDLHRFLQGVGVDPERAWEVLAPAHDTITVAGQPTPILSVPGRGLYVSLHAAHHGELWGKALVHLEHALAVLDEAQWREAATLAERLEAVDAFATGLRLLPVGAELAARLDLPATSSVEVALRATTPPPVALGFEQVSSASGFRERLHIIARKLFPPASFIRHWWPPAAGNRRMLVVGYLYRPVWLLRHAPTGFRAWRAARQRVRSGDA
jgi:hypothetical protein